MKTYKYISENGGEKEIEAKTIHAARKWLARNYHHDGTVLYIREVKRYIL